MNRAQPPRGLAHFISSGRRRVFLGLTLASFLSAGLRAAVIIYPAEAIGDLWTLGADEFREKYAGISITGLQPSDEGWYVRYRHENLIYLFGPLADRAEARKNMWEMETVRDAAIRNRPSLGTSQVDFVRFTYSNIYGKGGNGPDGGGAATAGETGAGRGGKDEAGAGAQGNIPGKGDAGGNDGGGVDDKGKGGAGGTGDGAGADNAGLAAGSTADGAAGGDKAAGGSKAGAGDGDKPGGDGNSNGGKGGTSRQNGRQVASSQGGKGSSGSGGEQGANGAAGQQGSGQNGQSSGSSSSGQQGQSGGAGSGGSSGGGGNPLQLLGMLLRKILGL